ncbi:hypothetical protein ACI782_16130 [Geodermatophilus sp. SYSU D00703]
MRAPSTAQIARTAFTLTYLVALAASGAPVPAAVVLGLVLVVAWGAPLLLWERAAGHRRQIAGGSPAAEGGVRAV